MWLSLKQHCFFPVRKLLNHSKNLESSTRLAAWFEIDYEQQHSLILFSLVGSTSVRKSPFYLLYSSANLIS